VRIERERGIQEEEEHISKRDRKRGARKREKETDI